MSTDDSTQGNRKLQTILLFSLCLVFSLYFQTLYQSYFADDYLYLSFNNHLLRNASWAEIHKLLFERANAWEFLPLRDLTYWLDFRLFGDELAGFHLTNLIWYALSIGGAYCLFFQLILFCHPHWEKRVTTLSFAGALLFAAHPAHVEAVAWVASRKDLVAASLGLFSLALLAHAMYHGRPWREVLVSAFLFFLACFGKSTTVAYVIFAGVLLCIGDRSREKGAGELAGLLLFFSLAALVSFIHIRVGADTGVHVENYPGVFAMVERASRILTALTGILLFPYPMRLYYDVYQYGAWHWLVSGGVVASGLVALHILMKQRSLSALGVVLMLSPTLIYLQFIPFSTWSMASERFVFISVAGLSLLVIDFLGRFEKLRTVCVVLAALIIPCAVVTSLRIGEWGSDGIYDMYDIERKHQPNFHVTVFDRIFPRLVMAKRYEEAKTLAQGLGRPYIVDAMLRYLDAHEAYTPFRKLSPSEAMKPELKNLRENFCEKSGKLHESTQKGREQQRVEHDISFYYTMNVIASMSEAYDDLGYEKLSCKPGNN